MIIDIIIMMVAVVVVKLSSVKSIISYPLFADTDTGIYLHGVSQYHARPKAKRSIMMLSVDEFPYSRKKTRGNEFISCSNDGSHILHVSAALKSQLSLLSGLNHHINTMLLGHIAPARKLDGRDRHCDVINDVPFSLYLTLMTSNVRYVSILHGC